MAQASVSVDRLGPMPEEDRGAMIGFSIHEQDFFGAQFINCSYAKGFLFFFPFLCLIFQA